MTHPSADRRSVFVIVAPGLEALTAAELRALGIEPTGTETGGVVCEVTPRELYAMHLHLRTASRVVVRAGHFHASAFHELERNVRRIDWTRLIARGTRLEVTASCRKSKLYHSDAVAERVRKWIGEAIAAAPAAKGAGGDASTTAPRAAPRTIAPPSHPDPARRALATSARRPGTRERTGSVRSRAKVAPAAAADAVSAEPSQLVTVRLVHDECEISLDASGDLLHLRGYRQAVAKAPLRETLAAGLLMASGWDASAPLVDPLCGSGTIPIEAALMARRIPPGLARADAGAFAFVRWPDFDAEAWAALIAEARAAILPAPLAPIAGSDRDAGAIESAIANAERAGVAADVTFTRCALSAAELPGESGWVVTNPPYGVRVGERERLRDLYAALGNLVRARGAGWSLAALTADRALETQIGTALGAPLQERMRTSNGGIPVRVVTARPG